MMLLKLSAVKKFVALKLKKTTNEHQTDGDGQDAEVPRAHVVVRPAPEPCLRLGLVSFGKADPRRGDVDFRAHEANSGVVPGMPATFVGIPAVIA
jgi:hypothetical protein